MPAWDVYQEEVAQFFRDLGLDAKTNQTVKGVRTNHDIDVLVRSKHAGIDMTWIVECKAWRSAVPKEKVLALRMIVEDTGVDRGFMMAEHGYQSGALEAARLTNILLTSLGDLREIVSYELAISKLKTLFPRLASCRTRYWDIDKDARIEHGLRHEVGTLGYSGNRVLQAIDHALKAALLHGFPVAYDEADAVFAGQGLSVDPVRAGDARAITSPTDLFDMLHHKLADLEQRLDAADAVLQAGQQRQRLDRE